MADIPNRNTVFPTWANIVQNLRTGVAIVTAPAINELSRLTPTAERIAAGVPTNIVSPTMDIIGLNVSAGLWDDHNTVVLNGSEYPEQISAFVPAGKTLIVNAGARWLGIDRTAGGKETFIRELPDNTMFIDGAAGSTINVNADNLNGQKHTIPLTSPTGVDNTMYTLGGNNVLSVTGSATLNADMGAYGSNAFVTADYANVKMGAAQSTADGTNLQNVYRAIGKSTSGHHVTAGAKADVFEYDFSSGVPTTIGANSFAARAGSTAQNDVDQIQLRALPAGSKVVVNVVKVGATGIFPDSDFTLTIKNAANATIGTIAANNVSYAHIIYADGTSQGINPKTIGAGGSTTITVGSTAPAAALRRSMSSVETTEPISPVNIATPTVAIEKAK